MVVTPQYGKYVSANLGVWYHNSKWKVYTEDISPMPKGTQLNIIAMSPGRNAFKIKQKRQGPSFINIDGKGLGKKDIVLLTHRYGRSSGYMKPGVGAYQYNGKWSMYTEGTGPIPMGMEFNAVVVSRLGKGRAYVHKNTNRAKSHISYLNTKLAGSNKNDLLFVTNSMTPAGPQNKEPIGVWYNGGKWTIYNQNRRKMKNGVQFNVYAVKGQASSGNSGGGGAPRNVNEIVEDYGNLPTSRVFSANNVLLPLRTTRQNIEYVKDGGFNMISDDIIIGKGNTTVRPRPRAHPKRPNFTEKYDLARYGEIRGSQSPLTAIGGFEDASECLWPLGIIPYEFDRSDRWTESERRAVIDKLETLDRLTNLTIIPRNGHTDYLELQKNDDFPRDGGRSWIGRVGGGQNVILGSTDMRMVVHEVLHAAGFYHEQCRPDRNRHVRILRDKVRWGKGHNFRLVNDSRPLGPYDLTSIMHYGPRAFGEEDDSGVKAVTIEDINRTGKRMGGSSLSDLDIDGINTLYPKDHVSQTTPPLRSVRQITATVKQLDVKSGTDGSGEVEFWAKISIGKGWRWRGFTDGSYTEELAEYEGRSIRPNWKFTHNVGRNETEAKVIIRVREDDGITADDKVDISPLNDKIMDLHLAVHLVTGKIYLMNPNTVRTTDFIGYINEDLEIQGFETRDRDRDESIPAIIKFRIDVRNPR